MGQVISKEQCSKCLDTGKDNLAVYEDGSTYCFGCGFSSNSKSSKPATNSNLITNGIHQDLLNRGISKKTCEFFDYRVGTASDGSKCHVANFHDEFGEVVGQKLRFKDKKFMFLGNKDKIGLYGQWKYNNNDNVFVTVVEGELDCLSVAEACGTNFPIVSLPFGAGNQAVKYIKESLEWLHGFKHVVLAFDNDETGQAASKSCIDLFEPGKVRVAKWALKDANDMLVAGRSSEIKSALFSAKEIRPDKILTPSDLKQRIIQKPVLGIDWPWKGMTECTVGMRESQLILVGAAPGIGKTSYVNDIILDMSTVKNEKCGIFSFEQDAADTVRRLVGGMIGKSLHMPGVWWDEEVISKHIDMLDDKVYIYDNWGGAKIEDLVNKIRYLAKGYGVKLFIVDHLTAIAAKIEGNERIGIEKAMEMLASLTRELKCSIILVSHLARDKIQGTQKDSWGSGRMPVLENFKGSGAIESWADVVLGLSRNADSEDVVEQQILKVQCLKSRLDGTKRGDTFFLKYEPKISRLVEM